MRITDFSSMFKWVASPWGFLLLLVCVGAFVLDIRNISRTRPQSDQPPVREEIQQVIIGLADQPYADPAGRFTLTPPAGWDIVPRSADNFYDVSFVSLGRANLNILATPVDYDDLRGLNADIQRREREYGIHTQLETTRFQNRDAIRRIAQLPQNKLVSYDFVENRMAFHILYEIPNDFAKDYEFALGEVLKTFKTAASMNSPPGI